MAKNISVILLGMVAIALIACAEIINDNNNLGSTATFASGDIKKFTSEKELEEFLSKIPQNDYYGGIRGSAMMRTMDVAESAAAPMAGDSAKSESTGAGASDYSTTNVQIEGVDEADFVKNDGKYIYVISNGQLVIVEAYPAEDAKIISKTKIDGYARNMLLNKDRLVIFADGNDEVYAISEYDFLPRPRYTQRTHVYVYDISDKEDPELVKDYNMNGYYYDSRMIGDHVYFISTENVYYYGGDVIMPMIKESSRIVARPDVYYFDNPEVNYNFNTVASFDIFAEDDDVDAKTFMMGYTNTLMVSKDNIYIAYQKNLPYMHYQQNNENRFYDVVVPLLPSDVQAKISSAKNDNSLDSFERWDAISEALEDMYNNMEQEDKQEFMQKLETAIEEYEIKQQAERAKTVIHRIKIDNGDIEYGAKGEVPGHLLNQFSMDEHEENLRVATTTQIWARKSVMYNNVFVLDPGMETIGKVEAIAPDERIYSTRFIGDKLYMVTFKNIDPFFVIDLSNPSNPKILGELKIPGFSDYLHPYDESHIIGIGKDTEANEWGGVSTKGLKIALFDVSDFENPKVVDQIVIGDAGTESQALHDHKAFLFDKGKNLLVLPVTEIKGQMQFDERLGYYRQNVWNGAYAFDINEDGIEVKGKIAHDGGKDYEYYWYNVKRSLYMDDVLYTISDRLIKASDLDTFEEIKDIKLPYDVPEPYPIGKPIPVDIGGGIGGSADATTASASAE